MKKVLKTIILIPAIGLLAGCGAKQSAEQILKDQKKKSEVVEALCKDPESAALLAEQLAKTPGDIQILTSNNSLIRQMTSEGNLSGLLKSDTATSYNLMADLIAVSSKDSVATHRLATLILANDALREELRNERKEKSKDKEKGKDGKEKKHKEHKGKHKKGKHDKE